MDNKEQPPHNNVGGSLRLPQFWAENSQAWFGIAESRFGLWNIEEEQVKFDLFVNALPKECLRTVLDLVTNPLEEDAYQAIKGRLSDHHNLTEFQRVEKIHAIEALGGRKPSELLHENWSCIRLVHFFSSSSCSLSPASCALCWVRTITSTTTFGLWP